jgi:hypothetical protein
MTDTYTVERKIRIDAPPSAVYERIVDLHRSTTRTSSSPAVSSPTSCGNLITGQQQYSGAAAARSVIEALGT